MAESTGSKLKRFIKSPEKFISEYDGIEWRWAKRDGIVGLVAATACVSALAVHDGEAGHAAEDKAPNDQVVEVTE